MTIKVPIVTTYDPRGSRAAQSGIGKFASYAKAAFAGIAIASAAAIGKLGMDSIQAASNYEESLSKVNVLFGDTGSRIEAFADTASLAFGQSATQALDAAATFATFGKAAGMQGPALAGFAEELTLLSSDLASFYNTDVEQAIQAIGSALRGENEPIRKFGVLLDDATLRAKAFEMGLIETTKNALTPQQKSLAAYQVIMAQTTDAQGDFERTSDGLANSQKTLSAVFADVQKQIGIALMPTFQSFVTWLKTDGVPGIQTFMDVLGGGDGLAEEFRLNGKVVDDFREDSLSPTEQSFKNLATAVLAISDGFADLFKTLEIDNPEGAFFTFIDGLSQMVKFAAAITRFGKGFIGDSFGLEDLSLLGKAQDLTGRLFDRLTGNSASSPNRSGVGAQTVINVNGSVLDPEGTARAIQRVLNQSQRRAGAY
jgi:hypothetical protein